MSANSNTNRADPEIVNKLERILQAGKNNNTDPDKLALKVALKAMEFVPFSPQCGGGENSLASITKSCLEKAFDVILTESVNLIHKGDFNPKVVATKVALKLSAVLLKAVCVRLHRCRTRRTTRNAKNNGNANANAKNKEE
jgi:hypothetical protein